MGKILIIDDAVYARDILKKILESGGHEIVAEAGNGVDGVALFEKTHPDITIVDMIMPKMNGIDTIKTIKKIDANAKILVISADGQPDHIEMAIKHGALGYINKPYQNQSVLNEIALLLGR